MNAPSGSPMTMPMRCPSFVDRHAEMMECEEGRKHPLGQDKQLLRVISGAEGIGKTTFAVELTYRLADAYSDGVLFYRCRGSESETRVAADEIAASLLRQFGVPETSIPVGAEDRISALLKELFGKKVMMVLDDVAGAEQVEPLLFESACGAVVVTTRNKLGALRMRGFESVRLGLLDDANADELLASVARNAVDELDSGVWRDVRSVCGGWPLALTLVGARLADPDEAPADYATELRSRQLDALEIDGLNPAQRVLDVGYQEMSPQQARAYALLSMIPGPHFELGLAAAVVDLDEPDAAKLLRELVSRHVLERMPHSRFGFHDLIRAHAREAGRAAFSPAEIEQAVSVARWWRLRRAVALDQSVSNRPVPLGAEEFYEQVASAVGDGDVAPRAEFELEWPNFIAALREAGTLADQRLTALFPLALWSFGYQTGRCAELIDACRQALPLATEPGRRWQLYRDLAGLHERLHELDAAEECLVLALETGYAPGIASVHDWLAQLKERRGDLAGAQAELLASWEAVPMMGDEEHEERARALLTMHLGRVRRKKGELDQAESDSAAAFAYFTARDEQVNVARSAEDMGNTLVLLDRPADASEWLETARDGFRSAGMAVDAQRAADSLALTVDVGDSA